MRAAAVLLVLAFCPGSQAVVVQQASAITANPIRRVVNLLQAMQKKVAEEGAKETELYEKFMCYCKTNRNDLAESVAAAKAKVPAVGSDIKTAEEQKVQLDEDLAQHQIDRDAAKAAMKEATAIREKESAAFATENATQSANIQAVNGAVAAISKGMAGGFLQTNQAQVLKKFLTTQTDLVEMDRQTVMSFLYGGQNTEYVPKGGEVTGILKELGSEMSKSLAAATEEENSAIQSYQELISAKTKEVSALSKSVETKSKRIGELAVNIVQMKNDLTDTEEALLEDQKFLSDLNSGCDKKASEWDERVKTRSEELAAIAETIRILNNDDALELFKKTLPGPGASFVQVNVATAMQKRSALEFVRSAQRKFHEARPDFDFLAMALRGRKVGLESVTKMIDRMVATLKAEQLDDDHKKEYCKTQLDLTEDQKKQLQQTVGDLEGQIENGQEAIAATKKEIETLEKSVKELDKTVAEATEQRKAEHEDFKELLSSNNAAKELLGLAKNRLHQFYNPKLARPMPESFVQLSSLKYRRDAPPPPPETFGAYTKKSESGGVLAMVDKLIKELERETTEAETSEEDAQKDYEQMMQDSAKKRMAARKSITEKSSMKASLETDLQMHKDSKESNAKELHATARYMASLHTECDWLMQYFDVRKEARSGEIDSLNRAKAVLHGADFSLIEQQKTGLKTKL